EPSRSEEDARRVDRPRSRRERVALEAHRSCSRCALRSLDGAGLRARSACGARARSAKARREGTPSPMTIPLPHLALGAAAASIDPAKGLALSPSVWGWQPKIDGAFVRVSTDRAGRI